MKVKGGWIGKWKKRVKTNSESEKEAGFSNGGVSD